MKKREFSEKQILDVLKEQDFDPKQNLRGVAERLYVLNEKIGESERVTEWSDIVDGIK